ETAFQHVIPELSRRANENGVYLGVGPDQNFTYIAALKPQLAFIVDIRRRNMLEHLMYKAIIELSADRAQFLSMLFSRPLHSDGFSAASPEDLFTAIKRVEPSPALFRANLDRILKQLTESHGFGLSASDIHNVEYVFNAFET